MKRIALVVLLIAIAIISQAQKRGHVVIHTSKRYISARLVAEQASKILGLRLNLRELIEHPSTGLTLPRHKCNNSKLQYPFYPLRNKEKDGVYISVEFSTPYKAWANGYYLVIVASGEDDKKLLTKTLQKARKFYNDAYIKPAS